MSEIEKAAKELVEEFRVDRENPENKGEIIKKRDMLPANPHDVMHMLHQVEAIKRAGKDLTVDSFVEAMETLKDYEDPLKLGSVTFNPDQRQGSNISYFFQVD